MRQLRQLGLDFYNRLTERVWVSEEIGLILEVFFVAVRAEI